MKKPKFSRHLALVFGCGLIAVAGTEADQPASSAASVTRAYADANSVRAVPIRNYWDAHSWEPVAGPIFWHDLSEKRRAEMGQRPAKRTAAVKGQAPAKSDSGTR